MDEDLVFDRASPFPRTSRRVHRAPVTFRETRGAALSASTGETPIPPVEAAFPYRFRLMYPSKDPDPMAVPAAKSIVDVCSTVKVPVAPAKRPVPPVIVAV